MLINYSKKELDLCARIMRAEALAEGDLGMLMVGNVVVNRAIANCLDFKDTRTITDVIYQKNQFSGTKSSLMHLKQTKNVKKLGLIKTMLEDIKIIAFTNQIKEFVKNYIDN